MKFPLKDSDKKYFFLLGLDPAGPFFSNKDSALDKDDAKYVDVIHTNAGGAGRYNCILRGHL